MMSISSVLVRVKPAFAAAAADVINAMPGAETRWVSEKSGKIVAVLESCNSLFLWRQLQNISTIEGVVAANLVYHTDTGENGNG